MSSVKVKTRDSCNVKGVLSGFRKFVNIMQQ